MAKFKLGDVVCLKSGSPKMTIILVCSKDSSTITEKFGYEAFQNKFGDSNAYYGTKWFDGSKAQEGTFPEEALESCD